MLSPRLGTRSALLRSCSWFLCDHLLSISGLLRPIIYVVANVLTEMGDSTEVQFNSRQEIDGRSRGVFEKDWLC